MNCDCGSSRFFVFGPYPLRGEKDTGLRRIYTCSSCGDQLRVYQAGKTEIPEEQRSDADLVMLGVLPV